MHSRYLIALALSMGFIVFYFAVSSEELVMWSSDILFSVVSGAVALLSFLVVKKRGITGKMGAVHLSIFLAMLMWFLGEATWTVYEVAMDVPVPYPSLADVFYLAGYVPLSAGLLQLLWSFRDLINSKRLLASILSGAAVSVLIGMFLIGPLLWESADLLTTVFDVAYPVLDVVVLVLCILAVVIFRGGIMARSWLWLSLGFALDTVADILFSHGTLTGWYYSGHPVELVWLWGYVLEAIGFEIQRTEI